MYGPGMYNARSAGSEWLLGDAEEQHRARPRSFFIPSLEERESIAVGGLARFLFVVRDPVPEAPRAERMWVEVRDVEATEYIGVLQNQPLAIGYMAVGDLVRFGAQHVIAINDPRWRFYEDKRAFVSRRLLEDDGLEPGFVCHETGDKPPEPLSADARASGWQLLVGHETDEELADPANCRTPNLAWIIERYPAFGSLVFSGARDGQWIYSATD